MLGTMQDVDLAVSSLFRHGLDNYPDSAVLHYEGGVVHTLSYTEIGSMVGRLASGLQRLGVGAGDVVATLCWNTPAHIAAYFAVPAMGAVLHTLNLRLHAEQIIYTINHAKDKVIIVDADRVLQLQQIVERLDSVKTVIVIGDAELVAPSRVRVVNFDSVVSGSGDYPWPPIDERQAAVLCYTTGTTGDPKGVAYSHRSIYLHSLMVSSGSVLGVSETDRVLPIVPMFHANAWGLLHAAWLNGSDIILNDRFLHAEHLARIISELRPTLAAGVPTLWSELDSYGQHNAVDFTSVRVALSGGSALAPSLAQGMLDRFGLHLVQGWGMTESSPMATIARPPARASENEYVSFATLAGRTAPGVQVRNVDEAGIELPWDGTTVGELQLRGPTITGSYFCTDAAEKFCDGWLRTGDLGVIHPSGWVQLKDRLKDGIKSGGEWISTIELEQALLAFGELADVAVIGVPDAKWQERPLACIVIKPASTLNAEDLRTFLTPKVARWWLPERWAFMSAIPKTSVGKHDKKLLRRLYEDGELAVEETHRPQPRGVDA